MKRPTLSAVFPVAGATIALAGTLVYSLARAEPAPAASVTAAPAAEEKALDFEPIPPAADKPVAPTVTEWQSATPVRLSSKGQRAKNCRAYRLREWLKVHCDQQMTAVSLLGGSFERAFFWLSPQKEGEPSPTQAEVMFPMRPGDRRIIELFSFGPAYGGSMISPGPVLQEHWIAGEPAPVVVIR